MDKEAANNAADGNIISWIFLMEDKSRMNKNIENPANRENKASNTHPAITLLLIKKHFFPHQTLLLNIDVSGGEGL